MYRERERERKEALQILPKCEPIFLNLPLYMFGHLTKNNIFMTFKALNVGQMYSVYDVCVCMRACAFK